MQSANHVGQAQASTEPHSAGVHRLEQGSADLSNAESESGSTTGACKGQGATPCRGRVNITSLFGSALRLAALSQPTNSASNCAADLIETNTGSYSCLCHHASSTKFRRHPEVVRCRAGGFTHSSRSAQRQVVQQAVKPLVAQDLQDRACLEQPANVLDPAE